MTATSSRTRRPGTDPRSGPAVLLACALPPWHRGCRAPARRVRGRRVRYHIGSEPGQINGRRWRSAAAR
ncbi:tryptophan biosynthesis modulator TrpM [Streptomyces sp. NPDC059649]|uniref:tryptophan biosynthesis modulator TrpM n=1 Tax=Streptomyces sp. NPDC059649 TaxID=3346895 RepID=UPI00368AFFF2